jgi:hypothetical protein
MSNLIQIKRSLNTANATGLANGELAYTANGDVLFIGSNGAVVAVGGARNPGVLTANQALVVNSTSSIDSIKVANLVPTKIYANGSHGSAGQVLLSNGTAVFWGTGTAGTNTTIQFNDSGEANGVAGFTFDKTTNTMFVGNVVSVGSNVDLTTSILKIGNSTVNTVVNSSSITTGTISGTFNVSPTVTVTLSGDVTGSASATLTNLANGTVSITTDIQPNSVALGTDTTGDYVSTITAGNGLSGSASGEGSTPTIAVVANNGLASNSSGVFAVANAGIVSNSSGLFANVDNSTLELSGGSIRVKDDGIALGTKTTGDYVSTVTAGNGLSGSASGEGSTPTLAVVANSGIASNSSGVFVVAGTGVTSNATGVHIGQAVGTTDNVTFNDLTTNGNTIIGSGTMDVVSFKALVNTNILPSSNLTYNLGAVNDRWNHVYASNVDAFHVNVSGNVSIGGDLIVTGNLTTVNVSSLSVSDPLIKLAVNNAVDTLYIGFTGHYNGEGNTTNHVGLVRSPDNKNFYLFGTYGDETNVQNNQVNVADPSFTLANLNSYLLSGGLVTNATHVTITGNSTVNVSISANTLTLSTALAGNSGGTGLNTYTAEDIIVANSTNGFRKLSLGTSGYVLQSNGTSLVYDTLDGGTF